MQRKNLKKYSAFQFLHFSFKQENIFTQANFSFQFEGKLIKTTTKVLKSLLKKSGKKEKSHSLNELELLSTINFIQI